MRAMVFAAGLGTRLRPLTLDRPKALVEAGGEAMLGHVMRRLAAAGVTEAVVNVHHFPDMVIEYLNRHDNFGIEIHVSDERDLLLDTGGGFLAARRWLDKGDGESIILHNADIYADIDFRAMTDAHSRSGAMATLLVSDRESSRALLFDDEMKMHGWMNRKTAETKPAGLDVSGLHGLAFNGVHIVSPAIFEPLERFAPSPKFSITDFYISACRDNDIRGYRYPAAYLWADVGTVEKLSELDVRLKNKR